MATTVHPHPERARPAHPAPGSRLSVASRPRGLSWVPRRAMLPGIAAAVGVGIVATVIGHNVPLVGTAVPGAVLGAVLGVAVKPSAAAPGSRAASLVPGLTYASSFLLQCSVVVLGSGLSLSRALRVGVTSLPVMLGTLAVCLGAAWLYGRLVGVAGNLRTLIGVGTGICGASAIAAASPVIEASSAEIAYAVSTIFVFNIAAVLIFPVLGHALGMRQHSFGLFAGTAVNDTSSVVATATTYGGGAAGYAVVVKLVRTLMIIPICVGLGWSGSGGRMSARRAVKLVPWFLIGFVLAAALNSARVIPASAHGTLSQVSLFLVAVALSAIGLSTDVAALRRAGARPLLLGALLWITVAAASLGLQLLTGALH